jgi:hypothetical protein
MKTNRLKTGDGPVLEKSEPMPLAIAFIILVQVMDQQFAQNFRESQSKMPELSPDI